MNRSIFQTDHAALVSRADLIYRQPVEHGRQGQPIGNGRMGTMVWTTPETVRFRINRSDVFAVNKDHKGDKNGPTDYWGGCARISVDVGGDAFRGSEGFAQHLSLYEAEEVIEGDGVRVRCFVASGRDVLVLEIDDRLAWTKIAEPLADYSVNGGICPGYDEHHQTYFAYIQPQGCAPVEPQSLGTSLPETEVVRRAVGLTRTRDFRHWPAAKLLLHPDAQDALDTSFYGACYIPYPGRGELHAMVLPVFHHITDHVDMQLAFSRDGLVWTRPERRAVLGLGPRAAARRARSTRGAMGWWSCRTATGPCPTRPARRGTQCRRSTSPPFFRSCSRTRTGGRAGARTACAASRRKPRGVSPSPLCIAAKASCA